MFWKRDRETKRRDGHIAAAHSRIQQGNLPEAEYHFEEALALTHPTSATTARLRFNLLTNVANIRIARQDLRGATIVLTEAFEILGRDPSFPPDLRLQYHLNLGQLLKYRSEYRESE